MAPVLGAALVLEELPDTGKTEQFFRPQRGILRPGLFLGLLVEIIHFQIRVWWGKDLSACLVVEIDANLFGRISAMNAGNSADILSRPLHQIGQSSPARGVRPDFLTHALISLHSRLKSETSSPMPPDGLAELGTEL